ncbi:helix-turn-helix domain-containing protein [Kitasatospora purpeofusca]|uniref:helix-turn-helix domain-containing protein n=1 Tax=Kitasatospora purpeofusca TaxID=67352 RepID=UPI003990C79E
MVVPLASWPEPLLPQDLRRFSWAWALPTGTPLSAIAASLGYGSDSAFSTAFKRATGLSPRHYRETARSAPEFPARG